MVSLMRNGPKMLFVATSARDQLIDVLRTEFGAEVMDIDVIFDKSDEFHTLLYLVPKLSECVVKREVTDAILIKCDAARFLCKLYMTVDRTLIDGIRTAPQTIIMRSIGDMNQMIGKIKDDFGGVLGTYEESVERGGEGSTIIGLTDKPLNRSTCLDDMHPIFLRLEDDYAEIKRELKMHAFSYVNSSIGNRKWYEMEIRIFDSYSAFKVHYERLSEVLDSLEMGLVLGESWSKDYPRVLMPVEVYSLRFFTFKEPKEIKRILFGLEHLSDGTRIVDYDLYYKNKKVYWKEAAGVNAKGERTIEALKARDEVYSKLDAVTLSDVAALEVEILKSRG